MSDVVDDEGSDRSLGILTLEGNGQVEVKLVTSFLRELDNTYKAIFYFTETIDTNNRLGDRKDRYFPNPWIAGEIWELPTDEQQHAQLPLSQELVLNSVLLSSPGIWEFLGNLNVLEVIRKYLNDRHERRKDLSYREDAESRRLTLENMARENEVLSERIKIARGLGATNRQLMPLMNSLLYEPLAKLDKHQDNGIISGATLHDAQHNKIR